MAFIRHRGKTKVMYFEGDTAKEVRNGGIVGLTDSGTVEPLGNDSLDKPLGIARRNDTVTDSSLVPVEVPVEEYVEWLIDLDSDGGALDSDIGQLIAVDTTGGASVNAGDSAGMRADVSDVTFPTILVTGRVSATQIIGVIAKRAGTLIPDTGTIT